MTIYEMLVYLSSIIIMIKIGLTQPFNVVKSAYHNMLEIETQNIKLKKTSNRALEVLSSTTGILSNLYGLEHGIFEILQGNTTPDSPIIDAIGPANEFFPGAMEPAFTIIPNFLITGIIAVILGAIGIIWSIAFIRKKYGGLGMFIISILLLLMGGGSAPVFLGLVSSLLASKINKPLNWWNTHLSTKSKKFLGKLWPWSIIITVSYSLFSVELAIFGWPLIYLLDLEVFYVILYIAGNIGTLLMVISIISGVGYDLKN
ncbi:MAG: hypothetical protein ACFFCV_11985 [Promethearchaeota archaeon]